MQYYYYILHLPSERTGERQGKRKRIFSERREINIGVGRVGRLSDPSLQLLCILSLSLQFYYNQCSHRRDTCACVSVLIFISEKIDYSVLGCRRIVIKKALLVFCSLSISVCMPTPLSLITKYRRQFCFFKNGDINIGSIIFSCA